MFKANVVTIKRANVFHGGNTKGYILYRETYTDGKLTSSEVISYPIYTSFAKAYDAADKLYVAEKLDLIHSEGIYK